MIDHPRLCAWLHVVSGLAIMVILSVTLAFVASQYAGSSLSPQIKSLMGTVGLILGTALCVVAGIELVGGIAFLTSRPVGRPLLLLSAAFHAINFPLGTALSVYTFWALLRAGGTSRPTG